MSAFTKDCGPDASPEHLASCPVCIEAQAFADELIATIARRAIDILGPKPPTAREIITEAARRRLADDDTTPADRPAGSR